MGKEISPAPLSSRREALSTYRTIVVLRVKATHHRAALADVLYQGTTLQAAENLVSAKDSYQGMTSVMP
jgi:hypothetical protein